ncbi:TPA: hypothetical protein JG883_001824 [Enterobacter hormaechei subsp. xiangfangensis]|uniref:hypothetical protein n=1 Tax=Enterobacter hormaechei TaxID=158836 RepID=UPI0009B3282B|nr:hypothetical protein [Enterobacter hormaechei]HAS0863000.1 hypothetical protein [Enterobacter hormaechei subsp. xiangfangensis]HAV1664487.1 hypothetical protein [Enterobacter hormaechei subsp. xiangfangensis]
MKLFEMEGFLSGKCLPGDLKVNETNAEYLVRKFAEADARCTALAVENAGLKAANAEGCKWDGEQWVGISIQTPQTDAFLAEVRAQGVEMAVDVVKQCYDNICAGGLQENREYEESIVQPHLDGIDDELKEIIAQLRKGVQS